MNKYLPRRIDRVFSRMAFDGAEPQKAMMVLDTPAYHSLFDHFLGGAVNTIYPAVGGTGTPARAINSAANKSQLKLTTTTTSADSATQALALVFTGTQGAYAACKLQVDTVANSKIEFGFSDALTQAGGVINVKATPTANATEGAVFCRDTTANTNLDFMTVTGGTPTNTGTSAVAMADATDVTLEVVLQNGKASGYVNGQLVGSGAVATGTALTPWLCVKTRTTTARNLFVEWLYVAGIHM
jgi:hypothetical protein